MAKDEIKNDFRNAEFLKSEENIEVGKKEKEQILQKITDLKILCQTLRIPMFVTVNSDLTNNGSEYYKDMVSAYYCHKSSMNDRIPQLLNVMNGFQTIPPKKELELIY